MNVRDCPAFLREWARDVRQRIKSSASRLARVRAYLDAFEDQGALIDHEAELQAVTTERNAAALESLDAADKLWREPRSFVDDATQPSGQVADDTTVPLDPPHKPRKH